MIILEAVIFFFLFSIANSIINSWTLLVHSQNQGAFHDDFPHTKHTRVSLDNPGVISSLLLSYGLCKLSDELKCGCLNI